jgi:MtrB/PioB family decaheme-associated outer membrane protein
MRTRNEKMKARALAVAVQGALLAMAAVPAHAEEPEIAELKMPTNFVEIGAADVSRNSAKFGEYTGMNKSGGDPVVNFGVRGGDAYGDRNGTRRWSISGTDLGLTCRALGATTADQGRWNLGIGYDELRHNISDSYQTPYQGSMGGNSFVLPAAFGAIAYPTGALGTRALSAAQTAEFHTLEIGTTRKNTSLTGGYNLTPALRISFDYNRLDQTGAKLMGFSSDGFTTAGVFTTGSAEKPAILPIPTNYTTDTFNLALDWIGDKGYFTGAYYASMFRDRYDRVTWTTFAVANSLDNMTTPPNNSLHQLNLSGGYALSPTIKLVGGLSYGRNTQNASFVVPDAGMMLAALQAASLNGLVVTSHADLRLSHQVAKDLAVAFALKYDKRDNQSESNFYDFNSLAGTATTAGHYPNTPFSNRKSQAELSGDYRLNKEQRVRLAYNHEDVRRWCNHYATNALYNYLPGTNCVVATATKDDKFTLGYQFKAAKGIDLNASYAHSDRKTDSDPLARVAFITANGGALPTPFANPIVANPLATNGLNGGDFIGFKPYFDASRRQHLIKARVNWQAGQRVSLGLGGRYTDDKYTDSTFGVQKGNGWSLNLDATYNYSDNGSVFSYVTEQHRQRDMTSEQLPPAGLTATGAALTATAANATRLNVPLGATWSNRLTDQDITFGLGFKHSGLMADKLELAADLTYSVGKTSYGTTLNYAGLTTGGLTCADPAIGSCGTLPDFKNRLTQLTLRANYKLNKQSKFALMAGHQKLSSDDWFYNIYQTGFTATSLMPSNQQSGSYSVSVAAATYTYSFR